MNILTLATLNEYSTVVMQEFLGRPDLTIAYLCGSTEFNKKNFEKFKKALFENGGYELRYFDLDRNFSADIVAELRRAHAVLIPPTDVAALNARIFSQRLDKFFREYFYIGGKLITCERSACILSKDISLAREWNEVPKLNFQNGLGFFSQDIYGRYVSDEFIRARLQTLSTQRGGRKIYALTDESALWITKDKLAVIGDVRLFYQGEMQCLVQMKVGSGMQIGLDTLPTDPGNTFAAAEFPALETC